MREETSLDVDGMRKGDYVVDDDDDDDNTSAAKSPVRI